MTIHFAMFNRVFEYYIAFTHPRTLVEENVSLIEDSFLKSVRYFSPGCSHYVSLCLVLIMSERGPGSCLWQRDAGHFKLLFVITLEALGDLRLAHTKILYFPWLEFIFFVCYYKYVVIVITAKHLWSDKVYDFFLLSLWHCTKIPLNISIGAGSESIAFEKYEHSNMRLTNAHRFAWKCILTLQFTTYKHYPAVNPLLFYPWIMQHSMQGI